ncbi:MAG: hypothetical protein HRT98_02550 [Mycoplasmatales bacterium]|nr:hypothetical protein [Mycoplasmatales bacterium]
MKKTKKIGMLSMGAATVVAIPIAMQFNVTSNKNITTKSHINITQLNSIDIKSKELFLNYKGLINPTFKSIHFTNPTTTTSKDGKVEFILKDFIPEKETVILRPGSKGILKIINNKVIVSGLRNGEHAEIIIAPIKGEHWVNGTRVPMSTGTKTLVSNYIGLSKPTIKSIVKSNPTTTTSKDGKVEFILTKFIPTKMSVTLNPGSKGILKVVGNKAIVSGLGNGEHAEIIIAPIKGEYWTNGTRKSIQSASNNLVNTEHRKVNKNKDGLSRAAIAGIVVGSISGLLLIIALPLMLKRNLKKRQK